MKRIKLTLLTTLGALLLAFAAASSASASGINFGTYPAIGKGEDYGTHGFAFSGGKTTACQMGTFSTGSVSGPVEALGTTVEPIACSSSFEGPVTIKMNGCGFTYHPAVGNGTFDLGGSKCTGMTLEGQYCTYKFGPQTGLKASFSNEGTPSLVRTKDEASLQYTVTKGGLAWCGASTSSASFTGTWKMRGFNAVNEQVNAEVVAGTGLYVTGEKSGEEAKQPKFAAEGYPVTITGYQSPTAKHALTLGPRKIECAEVVNRSSASAATSSLTLTGEFSGCNLTAFGYPFPTEVLMNSCSFDLGALNSGPPYSGSLGVACSKEGDAIEIKDYSEGTLVCTYRVAPQSGLGSVSLTNVGSGTEQSVEVGYNVSGLTVTRAKGTLAACGTPTQSATYTGTSTLHGLR